MRPNRQHRRRYGKSDEADAIGAARAALAGEAVGTPKAGTGQVEAIRLLRVARRSAMKARTQAGNQIHAVIDTAPDQLRQRFVRRPTATIVAEVARFHRRFPDTPLEAARFTLRSLARRWQDLNEEITVLDTQLDELTATVAPTLRAMNGVGPQLATALLAAPATTPTGCTRQPRLLPSAASHPSTPHQVGNNTTGSTATATAKPTGRCT
jgi:transposase